MPSPPATAVALLVGMLSGPVCVAAAQEPPPPVPPAAPAPSSPVIADARVRTGGAVAPGGRVVVRTTGVPRPVQVQQRVGGRWVDRGDPITRLGGSTRFRAPPAVGALRLRALAPDGRISRSRTIVVRALRLAAVGDINLGAGAGAAIDRFGAAHPWTSVGPTLRAADLAFGNLECAISVRGSAQSKQYTFRGRPSSLRAARTVGGLDVVNLANNHSGDYGPVALLDTLRHLRANDIVPVGAGATEAAAYRPVVVERLGLRVAFVGFSTILPFEFRAIGSRPGSAWGFPERVRTGIRRARAQADVVIATFHWGDELAFGEAARERVLAALAIAAGATAVIGAHPHVLQPVRRPRPGRLIAYSLGNFVFGAGSPGTARTGILQLGLSTRGVTSARFVRASIKGSRPVLLR